MQAFPLDLKTNITPGAEVTQIHNDTWRLTTPAGPAGRYRLAQLDDYSSLPRGAFLWEPPLKFSLQARASARELPGTWGFGFWNNPFSMGALSGSGKLRGPALPNAAWFFFAAPPNYLSLRDGLPAQGWLAATFCSPNPPFLLLALGALAAPFLLLPPLARIFRRLGRRVVRQDALALPVNPGEWHSYGMDWGAEEVCFWVDGEEALRTGVSPFAPLGFVVWIDNQYAAFPPSGRLGYGMSSSVEPAWIEIRDLSIS